MRPYFWMDRYLNELAGDIYAQPSDETQMGLASQVADVWLSQLVGLESILDVGCAQGQHIHLLQRYAPKVTGLTLGEDVLIAQAKGLDVYQADMSFLPFPDGEYQLLWARHTLEHSPMPLITLMEWHRVARSWMCLILPDPEVFEQGGINHYYLLNRKQWEVLMERAGWYPMWFKKSEPAFELRWLCEKRQR